jgi:phosphate:Na+ symporter
MKSGLEPLKGLPWFSELLVGNGSYFLAFVSGTLFSFVTQSSTAVSILVIGLAQTGLLGPFPAMMAIYGANMGSTFARMVLSSTLTGTARQLTAYQDLFKISGAILFVSFLYLEASEGVPLVHAFVGQFSNQTDRQMALVFLLFNLTTAIAFSIMQGGVYRLLQWWLPDNEKDDLSKPQFLYDEALNEPATALDLIEREQLRLANSLLLYPQAMRAGPASEENERARFIRGPFASVATRIEQFQHELLTQQLGSAEMERLTRLQSRLSLLIYLEDSLRALHSSVESMPRTGSLADLVSTFVEGLDFVLLTGVDALASKDPAALELLMQITGDRGDLVERMRKDFLANERATAAERAVLLQVTSVFERIVWMLHRLAALMNTFKPPSFVAAKKAE